MVSARKLLDRKVTEYPTLIDGLLPKCGLAALAGSSDTGKSSFLRDLALTIAEGKDEFLGHQMNLTHGRALYVSTEDDETSVAYLLYKQLGNTESNAYDNLRYLFDTNHLLQKIDNALTAQPVDIVIIDAYTDVFVGDINSSNQVRVFLGKFLEIAQKHNCCFMFLHHFGKKHNDAIGSKHGLLGSQGFEAKMRVVLTLHNEKSKKGIRTLKIAKGNYLSDEQKSQNLELRFEKNMRFTKIRNSDNVDHVTTKDIAHEKLILRISQLNKEGKSIRTIAQQLSEEGFKRCGKSRIAEIIKTTIPST